MKNLMNKPFCDIRIVSFDADRTKRSPSAPGFRLMYLSLSDTPPQRWCQIFDAERQSPRQSLWRRAWIEGGSIVVDCAPEELEQYHLEDLSRDVANSNTKFRSFLAREARTAEAVRQAEQIEQMRNRVNLDWNRRIIDRDRF